MMRPPPTSTLFPYTTLFRSLDATVPVAMIFDAPTVAKLAARAERSEEHTSELQSRENLVCRLLLEKKKKHHVLIYQISDTTRETLLKTEQSDVGLKLTPGRA